MGSIIGTTWVYRGYIRIMLQVYKVLGLGVPSGFNVSVFWVVPLGLYPWLWGLWGSF